MFVMWLGALLEPDEALSLSAYGTSVIGPFNRLAAELEVFSLLSSLTTSSSLGDCKSCITAFLGSIFIVFDSESLLGVTTLMYGGNIFIVFRLTEPEFFFNAFRFCSSCAASRHKGLGLAVRGGGLLAHALILVGSGEAIGADFVSTAKFLSLGLSVSMALDNAFSGGFGDVGVMLISLSTCENNTLSDKNLPIFYSSCLILRQSSLYMS